MVSIEDKAAPGTLQLIDATGQLHVKHSEAAHDVVLIPMPSGKRKFWSTFITPADIQKMIPKIL